MKILATNIKPVKIHEQEYSSRCFSEDDFIEAFRRDFEKCDRIDIAVGYASIDSLKKLQEMLSDRPDAEVNLCLGMYYTEGIPERTFNLARQLNEDLKKRGVGEVRLVDHFRFHGKLYVFYKQGEAFSAIVTSANLSAIEDASFQNRIYEVGVNIFPNDDEDAVADVAEIIDKLRRFCSISLSDDEELKQVPIIPRKTGLLLNEAAEGVEKISASDYKIYESKAVGQRFYLPLKAPRFEERFMDDGKHYTQSNINVCFSQPRSKTKPRSWWEVQFTVSVNITRLEGYPAKGMPFAVITDDHYVYKVHTTSQNNKQFNAVGNELLLGYWIKGRFVAAGLVKAVDNPRDNDPDRLSMITQEMLDESGRRFLYLQKTSLQIEDPTDPSQMLDAWLLGFAADNSDPAADLQQALRRVKEEIKTKGKLDAKALMALIEEDEE